MTLPINQIIVGDCLEVMQEWPDNSIPLTVTSPPYDNLRDYKGYSFDFEGIAKELYRITESGGVVVWVVADMVKNGSETGTSLKQALYFKQIGFKLHDTMIYEKSGIPFPESTRYNQSWEYMFIFSKDKPKTINLIRQPTLMDCRKKAFSTCRQADGTMTTMKYETGKDSRIRSNIWKYATGYKHGSTDESAHQHPAIFPEYLAIDHIKSWSNPDDVVLDIFSGSGTTCVAAKMLGRRYIAIDISEEYCNIARQRLEAVDTGVPVREQRKGQGALFPKDNQ